MGAIWGVFRDYFGKEVSDFFGKVLEGGIISVLRGTFAHDFPARLHGV